MINRVARWVLALIFFVIIFTLASNIWIISRTDSLIYEIDAYNKLPQNSTALVLGTSRYRSNGSPNPYFDNRIHAAADLFQKGKVKNLLVSGSSEEIYYNEPRTMRQALIKQGVPDSVIIMDPGGFRTFTSVLRAREAFNIDTLTVISNRFHLYRALFIAQQNKVEAIGYACEYVPLRTSFLTRIREIVARLRAIIDIYFFHTSEMDLTKPEPETTE